MPDPLWGAAALALLIVCAGATGVWGAHRRRSVPPTTARPLHDDVVLPKKPGVAGAARVATAAQQQPASDVSFKVQQLARFRAALVLYDLSDHNVYRDALVGMIKTLERDLNR